MFGERPRFARCARPPAGIDFAIWCSYSRTLGGDMAAPAPAHSFLLVADPTILRLSSSGLRGKGETGQYSLSLLSPPPFRSANNNVSCSLRSWVSIRANRCPTNKYGIQTMKVCGEGAERDVRLGWMDDCFSVFWRASCSCQFKLDPSTPFFFCLAKHAWDDVLARLFSKIHESFCSRC